jgi:putative endonuclease
MTNHIALGKTGEDVAVRYLEEKGYLILERNWRLGRQEIDIIAREGNFIVIAEVKTRRSKGCAEPGTSVNTYKQRVLVHAANAWMNYRRQQGEVRFDIITILIRDDQIDIDHITDAFSAML